MKINYRRVLQVLAILILPTVVVLATVTTFDQVRLNSLLFQATNSPAAKTVTVIAPSTLSASWQMTLPPNDGTSGQLLRTDGNGITTWVTVGSGTGTLTNFSFTNANGVSGVVTNPTTTPNLTISLGAITPSSIVDSGTFAFSGSQNFNAVTGNGLKIATGTGSYVSGHCVSIDASGNLVDSGGACAASIIPYDWSGGVDGAPASSQVVYRAVAGRSTTLTLTGSTCFAEVGATAQTDFLVTVNGSTVATLRFPAASQVCSVVGAIPTAITTGNVIRIIAPASVDASLASPTFLLIGTNP